jgi:hypothetical protein
MVSSRYAILYIVACTMALYACATTGSPTGGPEDETPPTVVTDKSTANYQVRYTKDDITLIFDEFVELRNPLKEIIVSPPLTYLPQTDQRGKRITFKFNEDEVLKPDATYVINFGKSIVDFTAGNALENYSFVFSTGDNIDSMKVSGTVNDAVTAKPVADMLVMLYEDLSDSIPYLERPFYAARTDKEGRWTISNIRADTFKLFGLADANVNYLYDVPREVIAPYDSLIILDTSRQSLEVELLSFTEAIPTAIVEVNNKTLGVTKLLLNQAEEALPVVWLDQKPSFVIEDQELDTILLYYPSDTTLAGTQVLMDGDTTSIGRSRSTTPPGLATRTVLPTAATPLRSSDSLVINWTTVLDAITMDSILLVDTSGQAQPYTYSIDKRQLAISIGKVDRSQSYILRLLPGAVTDMYSNTLRDTTEIAITLANASNSGTLELNISSLKADTANYIINLLDGKNVVATYQSMDQDTVITRRQAKAATYSIRLIRDVNRNRLQDGGQYLPRRRAESEKTITLQVLKADWTLESDIKWLTQPPVPPPADEEDVRRISPINPPERK